MTVTGSVQIDGETYYILDYNGSVGYVRAAYVYYAEFYGAELNVRAAKCLADKVGGRINVYASPAEGAEVIYTLSDGVRIDVAECGSDEYYLLDRYFRAYLRSTQQGIPRGAQGAQKRFEKRYRPSRIT